jgi:endonuclease G, mitochondrial
MRVYLLTSTLLVQCWALFGQQYEKAWTPLNSAEIATSIQIHLQFESDSPDNLICYRGYVVKYDYARRLPLFSIHKLTPDQINPELGPHAKRLSTFLIDEANLNLGSAMNADYYKSGWDRGHMVPAGDFQWNQSLKNETFLYSNISPQTPNLNRGIWAGLENRIRQMVAEKNQYAMVITGVILGDDSTIGPNKVSVPTHLYKLVFFPNLSLMYAFLFDNRTGYYNAAIQDFQVTVDEIEAIVQIDFFDKLEDNAEAIMEGTKVIVNEG